MQSERRLITGLAAATMLVTTGVPASAGECSGPIWDAAIGQPGMTEPGPGVEEVAALTVFDDGDGAMLYAAGRFTTAGGVDAFGIARWDGTEWSALPGGGVSGTFPFSPNVYALAVFDDGSGPKLFVGGTFASIGTTAGSRVAAFDGTNWSVPGGAVTGFGSAGVQAMTVFDDGSGPALYVAGQINSAGGIPVKNVARWNGTTWSAVGEELAPETSSVVSALTIFDDGNGPKLYAGTRALGGVARWTGTIWESIGANLQGFFGLSSSARSFGVFDDGSGSALYVGGEFLTVDGLEIEGLARWNGTTWSGVGGACPGPSPACRVFLAGGVAAMTVFDDGDGEALYVSATNVHGQSVSGLARWDGSDWTEVGSGIAGSSPHQPYVYAMAEHDDGNGRALFVGGRFSVAGGDPAFKIAALRACDPVTGVPGDLNGDGVIDLGDLLELLSAWGDCAECDACPADLTGSCSVGLGDLLELLNLWE